MNPMINKSLCLRILMVCLLFICAGRIKAVAGIEPYQHMLQGKIKKGDTLIVKDEKFRNNAFDWSLIRNKTVDNMIVFGFYRDVTPLPRKNFKCKIDLKIEYWSQPDQIDPVTEDHVELEISYDTAVGAVYQAEKAYHFKNGHRVKIIVNDITSAELGEELPDVFRLINMVTIDRQYLADPNNTQEVKPYIIPATTPPSGGGMMLLQITPQEGNGEVMIGWPGDETASEFDLDWTFIDAESANGVLLTNYQGTLPNTILGTMFQNNFTRVTVEGHQYPISLVHSSKFLLVRLRPVSYEQDGIRNELAAWEYLVHELSNTWHEPGKNWQYNASYAEEGKKKEVVSYADGTLRTRQSVTIANPGASVHTDENKYAVVQESIYDEFGRPAVSVLPSPVKAFEMKYYPLMNVNSQGTPYNFSNMYGAAGNCISKPEPMLGSSDVNQTSKGASIYYSESNPFKDDALTNNKFIPHAHNYPFAVTRYTPDNTGRVMVQGGVGETFQPGADGKATRYFYGKPEQWELDRLFGNDVGFAEHYLKNMTIDPNGQISISYQNASGKTIATALTGPTPGNMKPLASQPVVSTKTSVLLRPSQFRFDYARLTMNATANYMVSLDGPFQVNYDIDQFISRYTSTNVDICSNCYYTMKITVSDDCGNLEVIEAPSFTGSKLANCDINQPLTGNFTYTPKTLGTHYIRFELGLSEEVIGAYTDDYISRNTDLQTEMDFVLEQLDAMNFKDCISDCSTCLGTLGEKTTFINRVHAQLALNSIDVSGSNGTVIDTWSGGLYDVLLAHCQSIRQQCSQSPCDEIRELMLGDVSPGGQYALFTQAGVPIEPAINVLHNKWRFVFPPLSPDNVLYKREMFEMEDGTITSPHDSTMQLDTLVKYWNPAWAEKFLQHHPEWCALEFCNANSQYLSWDEKVKTDILTTAQIPLLQSGLQYSQQSDWLVNADPFFKSGGSGYGLATAFRNELMNYSSTVVTQTHTVKGLTGFVDYVLYCADEFGSTNTSTATDKWINCTPDVNCRVPDREWELYRNYYFSLKEKYYQNLRNEVCSTACKPGKPVTVAISPCPPASMFSIASDGPMPDDPSLQIIRLRYLGAPAARAVTLKLGFPEGYEELDSLIEITLSSGINMYRTSELDVNDIRIIGVECAQVPVTPEECNGVSGTMSLTVTGKRTGPNSFEETINGIIKRYYLVKGYSDEQPDLAPYCEGGTAVFRDCYRVYIYGSSTPISYYNVWVIICEENTCIDMGTYNMELSFGGGKYYGNGKYYFFNATPDCSSTLWDTHDCAAVTVAGSTTNFTNVTVRVCDACAANSQSLAPASVVSETSTTGVYVLSGYRYYVYGNTTDPAAYNPPGCSNPVKSWYNCFTVTFNGVSKVFYNASVIKCTEGVDPCAGPPVVYIYDRLELPDGQVYFRDIKNGGSTVCYYYLAETTIDCSTDPDRILYFPNGDGCVAFTDVTHTWLETNVTNVYECCENVGPLGLRSQQTPVTQSAQLKSQVPPSGIRELIDYNDGQVYLVKEGTKEPVHVDGATKWQFKDHYALRTGRNVYQNFSGAWVARKQPQMKASAVKKKMTMSIMSGGSVDCPISISDFIIEKDYSTPSNVHKYSLRYAGSYPIPANIIVVVNVYIHFDFVDYFDQFEFNSANYMTPIQGSDWTGSDTYDYYANSDIDFTCIETDDEEEPPTGTCDPLYQSKIPRFNDVIIEPMESVNLPQLHAEGLANLQEHMNASCQANVETWLQQLDECLTAHPDYENKRAALRAGLIAVCKQGGDVDHIDGASTTPPGTTAAVGNYTSFGDVIKQVMGISAFDMICNPWLIDGPYPYKVKRQAINLEVSKTTPEICASISSLVSEHTSSGTGGTLYNYLVTKYGDGMNISSAELDILLKGCNNCKYLLERNVKMPVFMEPGTKGCVTAQQYTTAKTAFETAVGGSPDPQHRNYQRTFAIYMNHQWGFTMGYDQYEAYETSLSANPDAMLCNKPAFSEETPIDPLSCIMTLVNDAVYTARYQYVAYIEREKKHFRDKYITVCSSTRVKATLQAPQQIYHYTLYYYDQAGQLIRTIPPEGVVPLTDAEVEDVVYTRENSGILECEYNGPESESTPTQVANGLNYLLGGVHGAMEFWLKSTGSGPLQVLFTSAGTQRYLYNTCINGSHLNVDVYKLVPAANGTSVDIVSSHHTVVDITPALPLRELIHVVIQGSDLTADNLQVFVNGIACPSSPGAPNSTCGWEIGFDGQNIQYPTNYSAVQHIRLYENPISPVGIAQLAANACMGEGVPEEYVYRMGWYRFNKPPGGSGSGLGYNPVYPVHRMATSYAYNTLGQVVQQKTPDAGISKYWYDYLGRLILSQNVEQLAPAAQGAVPDRYSYTTYDPLGRITEVGEALNAATIPPKPFLQQAEYNTVMLNTTRRQITRTYYDVKPEWITQTLDNLRKRVVATVYEESAGTPQQSTYYSYDLLGNVKSLWQNIAGLPTKQIEYKYDLASGKVTYVRYQGTGQEKFMYHYKYDAENRLIEVRNGYGMTGEDGWNIEYDKKQATYQYYPHGPLSRIELGEHNIQGIDYAYTLQGWLKGINGQFLNPAKDMGGDGVARPTFAKDVMAYSLNYFNDDYQQIGSNGSFPLNFEPLGTFDGKPLYNGNISAITTALSAFRSGAPVGYSYTYDQLNRLVQMRQQDLTSGATAWEPRAAGNIPYKEDITYDGNGNILTYKRNGSRTDVDDLMDELTYTYDNTGGIPTNRLQSVQDASNNASYTTDFKGTNEYTYDKIGNLIAETPKGASAISWTVYGKINSIVLTGGGSLSYRYDAGGNRVYKLYNKPGGGAEETWYVRDAQGNTLATYAQENGVMKWAEQHLYGSSRLGLWEPELNVSSGSTEVESKWLAAGNKRYELTNHLGNVLAVLSDNKLGTTEYTAEVISMQDYYPFGMLMVGRSFNVGGYRYGFNGKENDNEVKGEGNQQDYGMRVYDPRLGRFLSIDPLTYSYPYYTPYSFAGNKPIEAIDLDGLEEYRRVHYYDFRGRHERSILEFDYKAPQLEGDKIYSVHKYYDKKRVNYFTRNTTENFDLKHGKWEFGASLTMDSYAAEVKAPGGVTIGLAQSDGETDIIGYRDGQFVLTGTEVGTGDHVKRKFAEGTISGIGIGYEEEKRTRTDGNVPTITKKTKIVTPISEFERSGNSKGDLVSTKSYGFFAKIAIYLGLELNVKYITPDAIEVNKVSWDKLPGAEFKPVMKR